MRDTIERAIAIVGVGAILPDAPDVQTFWQNLQAGRYSITDVPADRWDIGKYYDPDPHAPERSYSKIGGWVRQWAWDPVRWKLPIPPKVGDAMDDGQKWAVSCVREALIDAGYPDRPLDRARTAVILGNAMAGERHYLTGLRVFFPEYAAALAAAPSFSALPPAVREAIMAESRARLNGALPPITEDTMPGELSNCIAGRIANLFDLHGPNYVVDAACASAVAAMSAAIEGLVEEDYDVAITGGIDRNMGPSAYVKFCKIGALSATGTRPYADGADGFVMGEGAAVFVLKRLADAERAGDRIYAVIRGVGGASDGKGKGITAPNPVGQRLALERAWQAAGLGPATASLIEGHGTSTRVGDVVEVEALGEVLRADGARPRSIPLGSVKSNIGHLKAAAGAAGLLKAALALHHKIIPPSLHFDRPNPNIDFERSPLAVQTALGPWREPAAGVRRAGVSAFGFGGTNFHAVLEEHVPGALTRGRTRGGGAAAEIGSSAGAVAAGAAPASATRAPMRGALVIGAATAGELAARLAEIERAAAAGSAPPIAAPAASELAAPERIAIDHGDAAELAERAGKARKALASDDPAAWRMLRLQGVFRGRGAPGKLAFLYPGQGSQYVGMLGWLRDHEPVVAETFAEADRALAPLLGGRALTSFIFADAGDPAARAAAEDALKQTAITQPALLAADLALTRLLATHGVAPDLLIGHSLGEYGALVAAGALSFGGALEAVSARGREMASLDVEDHGWMAAVTAPLAEIEDVAAATDGYVVVANLNSRKQAVLGGASRAVEQAMATLQGRGHQCVRLPVSHAFHTKIVAPATAPLRKVLERLDVRPPRLPVAANVTGKLYPRTREEIIEILAQQVAAPVRFVDGLETLYAEGARVFVEVGPKRALAGLAEDTLGDRADVSVLSTNHPKLPDAVAFNHALCGLYAAGIGPRAAATTMTAATSDGGARTAAASSGSTVAAPRAAARSVVITGAALGLPGAPRVFDDENLARLLRGESLIDVIPARIRRAIVDKRITRVVKDAGGSGSFQTIEDPDEVIRLAGRGGAFDLGAEFGVAPERLAALDTATRLAIGAGLDALRDAGIPLVHHYKTTSTGGQLPDRWGLPRALRDETGVIFASAFPGYDAFADDLARYHRDAARREQLALIDAVLAELPASGDGGLRARLLYRRDELAAEQARDGYAFDRRFLFRILAMGHSQFAELIGARGPNTAINAACASTTQAFAIAEDWIRAGRCRRVVVVAGDEVTSEHLLAWMGAGFLATGAAATDDVVEQAALPFDRRRHGMIMGMGAAAVVVEDAAAARERGVAPIAEVVATATANSAFHGTRLDVDHIGQVMEGLARRAEAATGIGRAEIAASLVFVSHETYTPARGGSASAEIHALRQVFGAAADRIVIANTKGFTGHAMGVGIEDVVAIKALETGIVPPVPNHRDIDPELGALNLSKGGPYPVKFALRLGAGFGSQISMTLLRWTPPPDGARRSPHALGYEHRIADRAAWQAWLAAASGDAAAEVEVSQRTLRIKDRRAGGRTAMPAAAAMPAATAVAVVAPKTAAVAAAPAREAVAPAPAPAPALAPPAMTAPTPSSKAATAGAPAPASAPASSGDAVRARVLAIVADKTGYPVDMLDDGLDLEADLGVDTVKQAETFAAVRAAYDIPRQENLKLRDFPTLAHVVRFVYTHRPDLSRAAADESAARAAIVDADATAAAAFPRRVPTPVLRPPIEQCLPTGVALDQGARVLVVADRGGVAEALRAELAARGVEPIVVGTDLAPADLAARVAELAGAGPIRGAYWLPALDDEGDPRALDAAGWREALRVRWKLLAAAGRALYDALTAGAFFVSATRMGGAHGYDDAGAAAPLGGAVAGFTKALARERPDATIKVVDFGGAAAPAAIAGALIAEAVADPGALEIGLCGDHRIAIGLAEAPLDRAAPPALALDARSRVVVTGAAGSIVAAIVADLAARMRGGTFELLDLAPAPRPGDPDLDRLTTDRDRLKRDLFERLRATTERPTPALVERELARLERQAAARAAIDAITRAGGVARYHQVDLCDPAAVAAALADARAAGRVDAVVHAAGIDVSRRLVDKDPRELDRVFDVKIEGFRNVLAGLGDVEPRAIAVFSSIAGRFGNLGQTDYSAANDLLCKLMSNLRRTRPAVRGIAIDWTAWAEIGMAARGSIPQVMAAAGIDLLPPAVGVPVLFEELSRGGGEVVIAGALGVLVAERVPTGGLDPARAQGGGHAPMLGAIAGMGVYAPLVAETVLDPRAEPFLDHHRIDGTAVLPGVMGIEAFAELAARVVPGARVRAVEDVRFAAPFKFYRDEPRAVRIEAWLRPAGDEIVADCALIGVRELPGRPPQRTVHFTGRVRLAAGGATGATGAAGGAAMAPAPAPDLTAPPVASAADIYQSYFHGPAYQVLDAVWAQDGHALGRMASPLPPDVRPGEATLLDPREIELCFQTAGIWERHAHGDRLALPREVAELCWLASPAAGPLLARVHARDDGAFDAEVADGRGTTCLRMRGYRTVTFDPTTSA
jgi:acyl transferase domain-containing protein